MPDARAFEQFCLPGRGLKDPFSPMRRSDDFFLARVPHETGEENFSLGITGCMCCSDVLCVQALCSGLGVSHIIILEFWKCMS